MPIYSDFKAYKCPRPPAKILLISTRQFGDLLLTTPLVRSLKHAYPQAIIDVLAFQGKEFILDDNPDINQILTIPEPLTCRDHPHLFKQIWRKYHLAVTTLPGDRPTFYAWIAAPQRVGLVPSLTAKSIWKRWLLQGWVLLDDEHTATVIQNLRLADVLEIPRCYKVVPPEKPGSEEQLNQYLPFSWRTQAYAALHLTPMWPYKRWTLTGWTQVSQYLQQQGMKLVLTGGSGNSEQQYLQQAQQQMPGEVINLAGKLDFAAISLLLKHAKVYVGPDTAVTHLAAAVGVPTVAIFGPTNPLKWAPWPQKYDRNRTPYKKAGSLQILGNIALIQGEEDCIPCHQEGCERHRNSHSLCLRNLDAAKVITAIKALGV